MSLIDARTTRVLFTALLFALAVGFLYIARRTLIAFLFAILFAYLIDPLVSRTERLVRGRGRAIAIIYILLIALLITFFFFVGPNPRCWKEWALARLQNKSGWSAAGACELSSRRNPSWQVIAMTCSTLPKGSDCGWLKWHVSLIY